LYDIDRDVLRAVYRPTRVLQHLRSVGELLHRPDAASRDTRRLAAGQRVRRALVERPVVYDADLDPGDRGTLRTPSVAAEVAELTGMVVERRAEGIALLDVSGRFSDRRFPGSGTVAQAALLLINRIADRVLDPDAPTLLSLPAPAPAALRWAAALDSVLPRPEPGEHSADRHPAASADSDGTPSAATDPAPPTVEPASYPMLGDSWLTATMAELIEHYGSTFRTALAADPKRLLNQVVELLSELSMVIRVPGGVLALPMSARYRNAVVDVRKRTAEGGLFDL
jgi:hypothetical protein